jgi:hypothetical protein
MSLDQPDQERASSTATPSIRADLRDDHARLERRFQSVAAEASRGDPTELRRAWGAFERELVGHLDAEETHLLGTFADQEPEEARAILAEHAAIRAQLTQLGIDLDLHALDGVRIAAFIDELRAHARREHEHLYPWADERLDREARVKIRIALDAARRQA